MLEEYRKEEEIATSCRLETFQCRMSKAGLGEFCATAAHPRRRCSLLQHAGEDKSELLDEHAQRNMIKAIGRSIPSYMSGLRCWAAFCDAHGEKIHFPASSALALRYTGMFHSHATLNQYLKHLRWALRFLHYTNCCETPTLKQAMNGIKKSGDTPKVKLALLSRQVAMLIQQAERQDEVEVAALAAISRLFLLRVPSEAVPLEWDGNHSKIQLTDNSATITLMRRKNLSSPSRIVRNCCCKTSGNRLCAVHWLHRLFTERTGEGRLFTLTAHRFKMRVRQHACDCRISDANRLGTHAFRRGMAQDIVSAGGSLAVLLRAGDWHSKSFLAYLKDSQPEDEAVAQFVINISDSEAEF